MKSKWRNYGLWLSLTAALLLGVQTVGVIFGVEFTADKYEEVTAAVNAVLGILVVLGIVSNPEAGKGYMDKE
jgi:phi LC3 family holin